MTLYLDTSVIVPLFTIDAFSAQADELMASSQAVLLVSDFAAAEFTSVISRRCRISDLTGEEGEEAFTKFDTRTAQEAVRVEIGPADLTFATAAMRRLDLALRTPDAIHIAIARRQLADIATFDRQMAQCAETLGLKVVGG